MKMNEMSKAQHRHTFLIEIRNGMAEPINFSKSWFLGFAQKLEKLIPGGCIPM